MKIVAKIKEASSKKWQFSLHIIKKNTERIFMANCIGYHCASSRHMNSLTFPSFALRKHDKLDCLVMYNALNLCIYRIYEIIRETLMDKKNTRGYSNSWQSFFSIHLRARNHLVTQCFHSSWSNYYHEKKYYFLWINS